MSDSISNVPGKPLGHKSYGSIGHLPGSRRGPGDHGINDGQARILTVRPRDKHDRIIVQEKLDGSNVAVANISGILHAIGRAGHLAISSPYEQHRMFANWVLANLDLFNFLEPGERLCGEWLAEAHGTRYELKHDPFVPFDIMRNGHERATFAELHRRASDRFTLPDLLSDGPPITVADALDRLRPSTHGALDPIEGIVYRCERANTNKVDFLAKWVRPDKVDGKYIPGLNGNPEGEPVWNWRPTT